MRKLLAKLFIKDYKNYNDPKVRSAYGSLSGIVGIISNFILCIIKVIAGFLANSISIMADGINNLTDAGSSVVTLIGFKLSSKPADSEHPFGHERIEYISALVVSFIVLFIGGSLFITSAEKFFFPVEMVVDKVTYIILGISVLLKLWQWSFYRGNGKLISSPVLMASATDSISDAISTTAVIVAMILSGVFSFNLDGYMGLVVSILIVINGIKLVKEAVSPLIGEAPTKEFVDKIVGKILSHEGVLGIHDLVIHSYGPYKTFITVHVEVDGQANVFDSHDMIDNIEQEFRDEKINLDIHMDPIDTQDEITINLKDVIKNILNDIDSELQFHDFRVVTGPTHTNLIFDVVLPMKYKLEEHEVYDSILEKVKAYDKKLNIVVTFDRDFTNHHHRH